MLNAIGICGLGGVLFFVGCSSATVGPGQPFGASSGDTTSGSGSTSGDASGQGDDAGAVSSQSGSPMAASGGSSGIANGGSAGMPAGSGSASSGSTPPVDAGDTADAAAGIPANNAEIDYTQTKSITMDSFTLEPNQEVYKCQDFPNPWGTQVDIKTYALNMSEGSHHMFPFYKTGATKGAIIDCPAGGVTFGPFTFTSQLHSVSQTYPDTVGATIPQSTGFTMMVHYLNTSAAPITTHVTLQMAIAKAGAVTQHAGVLYLDNTRLTGAARSLHVDPVLRPPAGCPDHVDVEPHASASDWLHGDRLERRDTVHDDGVGGAAGEALCSAAVIEIRNQHHVDMHIRQQDDANFDLRTVGCLERHVHLHFGLLSNSEHVQSGHRDAVTARVGSSLRVPS